MNGAGAGGPGGGGICGRPTSAVDQVPTQRSADVCARDAGSSAPAANTSTVATTAARNFACSFFRFYFLRYTSKTIPFFRGTRVQRKSPGRRAQSLSSRRPACPACDETAKLLRAALGGKARALRPVAVPPAFVRGHFFRREVRVDDQRASAARKMRERRDRCRRCRTRDRSRTRDRRWRRRFDTRTIRPDDSAAAPTRRSR